MMMNAKKDSVPPAFGSTMMSSDIRAIPKLKIKFPMAQLKLIFQEIVFSPKYKVGADYFKDWISSSVSFSATDTTTNTLYSDDYNSIHTLLSLEDIQSLRDIAEMLSSSDYLHDCSQIYIERRRGIVNLIWRRLYQKLNIEAEQDLNGQIQWWIQVAKILLSNIFVMEKCFYEQIFGGLGAPEDSDDDYVHIIGESATKLFEFAGSLVASRQLAQRLELLLHLYQELLDLMPTIDVFFQRNVHQAKVIHSQATRLLFQMAQHTIRLLSSSERQVLHEISMVPIPGGGIHFITKYVVNYIDLISNHRNSLMDLISTSKVQGLNGLSDCMENNLVDVDGESVPLSHHATRVIESLLHNLKTKSKSYKNEPLGHLFMMNNVHYVVQRIKSSQGMQEIIDRGFETKLSEMVDQAMSDYLRTTWNRVWECLETEKSKTCSLFYLIPFLGNSTKAIKRKFKTFNQMFEDIHKNQAEWFVQDQKLRTKLQQSILDKLIPAYAPFLEQYSCRIEKVKHPERYIKYSVNYLQPKVWNLFQCEVP